MNNACALRMQLKILSSPAPSKVTAPSFRARNDGSNMYVTCDDCIWRECGGATISLFMCAALGVCDQRRSSPRLVARTSRSDFVLPIGTLFFAQVRKQHLQLIDGICIARRLRSIVCLFATMTHSLRFCMLCSRLQFSACVEQSTMYVLGK